MSGIETPNYTQVPNVLFEHLADMSETELKCTLAIIRQIIGYHKDKPEAVSYSQLQEMTGLSRQGVTDGVKASLERGYVKIAGKGKRGANLFTLNFVNQSTQQTSTSPLSRPELVNSVDTQKKEKETPKEKSLAVDTAPQPPSAQSSESPTPRGSKRTPVSSERMNPMKDAIALAFGWSWERMTPSEAGQIQKTARELCLVDATPDDVPRLMAYCRSKFDHFKPPALAANYTNAMKWTGWRAPDSERGRAAPTASELAMAHALDAMEAGDERDTADTLAA